MALSHSLTRGNPELEFEIFDEAHRQAYAQTVGEVLAKPGVYRKRFRARRGKLGHLLTSR